MNGVDKPDMLNINSKLDSSVKIINLTSYDLALRVKMFILFII